MSDENVSRRKFFMHSAHKSIGVSTGLAALHACDLTGFAVEVPNKPTPRVFLVSGSPRYNSDESLVALEAYLNRNARVQCTRVFATSEEKLPGLEDLDQCDCMVLLTRRMKIDGEPLDRIKRYCRRGGAIVGVRTASHGLQNWLAMDKEVFGGDYRGHYNNTIAGVSVVEAAKHHPVLAGVRPFVSHGALYKNRNVAKDAKILLTGSFPDRSHPVAWTRLHNGGRIFYTSLGHPADFRQPDFLRLLTNAIAWAT